MKLDAKFIDDIPSIVNTRLADEDLCNRILSTIIDYMYNYNISTYYLETFNYSNAAAIILNDISRVVNYYFSKSKEDTDVITNYDKFAEACSEWCINTHNSLNRYRKSDYYYRPNKSEHSDGEDVKSLIYYYMHTSGIVKAVTMRNEDEQVCQRELAAISKRFITYLFKKFSLSHKTGSLSVRQIDSMRNWFDYYYNRKFKRGYLYNQKLAKKSFANSPT